MTLPYIALHSLHTYLHTYTQSYGYSNLIEICWFSVRCVAHFIIPVCTKRKVGAASATSWPRWMDQGQSPIPSSRSQKQSSKSPEQSTSLQHLHHVQIIFNELLPRSSSAAARSNANTETCCTKNHKIQQVPQELKHQPHLTCMPKGLGRPSSPKQILRAEMFISSTALCRQLGEKWWL